MVPVMAFAQTELSRLRTSNLEQATGIDPSGQHTLSWVLSSDKRNTMQQAYEVVLSKNGKKIWQTGRVESDNSTCVSLDSRLEADSRYEWKVRVWDNHGQVSRFHSACFTTGLTAQQWNETQWISSPVKCKPALFRTQKALKKSVARATAYITSHGIYEASINGLRVGEYYLTPGWTSYRKRLQYQAYDITSMLKRGNNEIRVTVAPGWYASGMNWGKPEKRFRYGEDISLLCQIRITYTDGSQECIHSSSDWECSECEVREATIYDGETIDRNIILSWKPVLVANMSKENLIATENQPVRKHAVLNAQKIFTTPKGEKVIDFGQNIVGWEKVHIKAPKGTQVRITHAEVLDKNGNFYTTNLRAAKATSLFIVSDPEGETFEPTLTFYGFRYIRIEGLDTELRPEDFQAVQIHSAFERTGEFSCSDKTINQLQHNIDWGFRGNFLDIPTDCPQRDERLGWTGDAQVFFRTASFLGGVDAFFTKWMKDLAADQWEDGAVPYTIPDTFFSREKRISSAGWADASTIIPWNHYMAYGDKRILENQYESMKRWVGFMIRETEKNGFLLNMREVQHYGDWLFWSKANDPDGQSAVTSRALIAQCFFALSVENTLKAARVLGRSEDEKYYAEVLNRVRKAYLDEYVTPNGLISSNTQTAYVLALAFDMLPHNLRQQAAQRLADNISEYKDHITTGFLGTPYICEVLTNTGHSDVAYRLLMQKTCPSWIYPISKGATTIWERWNSIQPDGSIIKGMNSFNHYSYGCIGDWLYRSAVGIREAQPGYKRIIIRPHTGGGFEHMQASTITPYGKVSAFWKASKNKLRELKVTVPANTTAAVYVPSQASDTVSADDSTLQGQREGDYLRFEVGSGQYTFTVTE